MHADAPPREWQGDAAGADAELERGAAASELDQEVDDRVDDRRIEHVGGRLVVPLCHTLAEVVLGHERILSRTQRRYPVPCPSRSRACCCPSAGRSSICVPGC